MIGLILSSWQLARSIMIKRKHFYLMANEAKHLKYLEKQSSMVEDSFFDLSNWYNIWI